MNIEDLENGCVRLTADNGVLDIRTMRVYSQVVCRTEDVRFFMAA